MVMGSSLNFVLKKKVFRGQNRSRNAVKLEICDFKIASVSVMDHISPPGDLYFKNEM